MEKIAWGAVPLGYKEEVLPNRLEAEIDKEKIRYYILSDELF